MASIVSLLTDTGETIHAKAFTIEPPSEPTRRLGRYHPARTQVWTGELTQKLALDIQFRDSANGGSRCTLCLVRTNIRTTIRSLNDKLRFVQPH